MVKDCSCLLFSRVEVGKQVRYIAYMKLCLLYHDTNTQQGSQPSLIPTYIIITTQPQIHHLSITDTPPLFAHASHIHPLCSSADPSINCLHSEQDQEADHEREQASSLSERKSKNGIREQLSSQAWVSGNTGDQSTKNRTDTSSGTDQAGCSNACTNELACTVDGGSNGDGLSDDAAGLRVQCVAGKDVKGCWVAEHATTTHQQAGAASSSWLVTSEGVCWAF